MNGLQCMEELTHRQQTILSLVVREYVKTASPVSSRALVERYGLKVSLHTPLAGWASAGGGGRTYPAAAWRVDSSGRVVEGSLCSGSQAYLEEEACRLIALADAGVCYFMFDGSQYTGPCFSEDHGLSLIHISEPTRLGMI